MLGLDSASQSLIFETENVQDPCYYVEKQP